MSEGSLILEEIEYIRGLLDLEDKDTAVRVEGQDDEYFWEEVFKKCQPNLKTIVIIESIYYPSEGTTGKRTALDFVPYAAKDFLICIDSDYDYILQDETINSNPYILQTYANSIENIICNPNRLSDICCHCANVETIDFDFEMFFIRFSEIVYSLFLVSLAQEKIRNTGDLDNELFDRRKFGGFISMNTVLDIDNHCEQALDSLQERVTDKELEISLTVEEKANLKAVLAELDIDTTNVFWHIRGKNIMDGVTMKLLRAIIEPFHHQKITDIRNTATDLSLIPDLIQLYKETLTSPKDLLINNYPIDNNPFFPKIQSDIQNIFSN